MNVVEPHPAGQPLAPGYVVIEHLSRGQRLDVYDVWSDERDCRCVAKLLRPDCLENDRARRRLKREGRLLKRLTHPHLVRAYETIDDPFPIVIMETLTGETLSHFVHTRRRRLPAYNLTFLGIQLCSVVQYLHRHRLLHLDLKPSNIMAEQGMAKLFDLSLARAPGREAGGIGTQPYMAPEQARGGTLTEATDIWGIGAVLYTAATARLPFPSEEEDRYEQLERRADLVGAHRRLPRTLARAIDACLEPLPARRPGIKDLAQLLSEHVGWPPLDTVRPQAAAGSSSVSSATARRYRNDVAA
jgi:serine/threonine protein kinase